MLSAWVSLLIFLVAPNPAFAETLELSVYKIAPLVDGTIIGITAAGTVIPFALKSELVHPYCPCDPSSVNSFDRPAIGNDSTFAANLSDVTVGAVLLGLPLADYLLIGANRAFIEDLVVYGEVLSVNGAFLSLAQYTVQRPVPLIYSGNLPPSNKNGYDSFYSGHTSFAFAALSAGAMTADLRYHAGVLPWIAAGAVGISVAYERVAAGQHFATDVLTGALIGTAEGVLIPWLHSRAGTPSPLSVTLNERQVGLTWNSLF